MPFQCAEVIAGIVALPASVRLRHSYSIQPGSKSPFASRFCAIARCPSAWSCFRPSARSRQAIARSRSSTSTKISDRLTRCSGLLGSSRIDLLTRRQRFLHPVGVAAHRAEMRVPGRIPRPQLDRPAQQLDAVFRIVRHGRDDAQQRQRGRIFGRDGQHVRANPARLVQPLRLGGRWARVSACSIVSPPGIVGLSEVPPGGELFGQQLAGLYWTRSCAGKCPSHRRRASSFATDARGSARMLDGSGGSGLNRAPWMAGVAQLVERQVVVLDAVGSSPIARPILLS